ncbi:MAG: hypothetical protein DRJ47_08740 [Thermoprotei archaeon]|nr:MAG: hypothetical protein DRJ47_08740 [Thermoprotei archaeon]
MKVGVVVWAEGTIVKFRIAEGIRVERGQLLKVYARDTKYILRVFDFRPESLLTPAEIARLSHKRERGEEVVLYDKSLRLYDTAIATVIAQVEEDGHAHGPTSLPPLFSNVETLDELDLEQLNLDNGDLAVGCVRIGHKETQVTVRLKGEKVFPHHILISGVTGAGKSNLGKILAYTVMKTPEPKYSLILFDTESEYFRGAGPGLYGLAHLPEAETRLFYISDIVEEPTRIEFKFTYKGTEFKRQIFTHPLEVSYTRLHPLDFVLTGEFTSPQEELLWLAWKLKKSEWLEFLTESASSLIYRALGKMVHMNTINTAKRKIRHMLGSGEIFKKNGVETDLFNAIIGAAGRGKIILVDMPNASEGEEKLLAAAIARRIFKTYEEIRKKAPYEWEKLPYVMIMVEEAHKYLSKQSLFSSGDTRENIFSIISKRGRKYKVSGLYITQMPGELIEPVIRQTMTKIILSLPTRPDYLKIIEYSPYLDEAAQEIKALDKGEALIVSPVSGLRFAVPVKIFCYEKLVEERLEEELVAKRIRIPSQPKL